VDTWHLVTAPGSRGMPVADLAEAVRRGAPGADIRLWGDADTAIAGVLDALDDDGCVLVFGSFTLVEAALRNPRMGPV
jgi:folylpolyglutamate synthase/dihydropteroate synthase